MKYPNVRLYYGVRRCSNNKIVILFDSVIDRDV